MIKLSLVTKILSLCKTDVDYVLNLLVTRLNDQYRDTIQLLNSDGWEQLDECEDSRSILPDGRPVVWVAGLPFALSDTVWQDKLKKALQITQYNTADNAQAVSTCTAIVGGNLCGGDLISSAVCIKSQLGRSGVSRINICDICGAQTAVMR